jgi:hypothetical protein
MSYHRRAVLLLVTSAGPLTNDQIIATTGMPLYPVRRVLSHVWFRATEDRPVRYEVSSEGLAEIERLSRPVESHATDTRRGKK